MSNAANTDGSQLDIIWLSKFRQETSFTETTSVEIRNWLVNDPLLSEVRIAQAIQTLESLAKRLPPPSISSSAKNDKAAVAESRRFYGSLISRILAGALQLLQSRATVAREFRKMRRSLGKRNQSMAMQASGLEEHLAKRAKHFAAIVKPTSATTTSTPLAIAPPTDHHTDDKDIKTWNVRQEEAGRKDGKEEEMISRTCYCCRKKNLNETTRHAYYAQMCQACGALNYNKRQLCLHPNTEQKLAGQYALVTGGRIKIGYETCLSLLRSGCHVLATTRFIGDAAKRYAAESDSERWLHRLTIHQLDLSNFKQLIVFRDVVKTWLNGNRLMMLINNAAQTIKRHSRYYARLLKQEQEQSQEQAQDLLLRNKSEMRLLPSPTPTCNAIAMSGHPHETQLTVEQQAKYFPKDQVDRYGEQLDLSPHNSWSAEIEDISLYEIFETMAINCVAPMQLAVLLQPLMRSSHTATDLASIINVSSMEGQFAKKFKSSKHVHTNVAKAGLNMLTRTIADRYRREFGILVNAVDTGWIDNMDPRGAAELRGRGEKTHLPLDVVDGAARILDPIWQLGDKILHSGVFFKDYKPTDW